MPDGKEKQTRRRRTNFGAGPFNWLLSTFCFLPWFASLVLLFLWWLNLVSSQWDAFIAFEFEAPFFGMLRWPLLNATAWLVFAFGSGVAALLASLPAQLLSIGLLRLFAGELRMLERAWKRFMQASRNSNRLSQNTILYLRAHDFDDGIILPKRTDEFSWLDERVTFHEAIARELEQVGQVLSVGGKVGRIGGTTIDYADDSWRYRVDLDMQRAAVIAMLPGSTPGVIWEMRNIMEGR